jgi:hypothetical protein
MHGTVYMLNGPTQTMKDRKGHFPKEKNHSTLVVRIIILNASYFYHTHGSLIFSNLAMQVCLYLTRILYLG